MAILLKNLTGAQLTIPELKLTLNPGDSVDRSESEQDIIKNSQTLRRYVMRGSIRISECLEVVDRVGDIDVYGIRITFNNVTDDVRHGNEHQESTGNS